MVCFYCGKEIDCSEYVMICVNGAIFYAHKVCHEQKREGFCGSCLDIFCGANRNVALPKV